MKHLGALILKFIIIAIILEIVLINITALSFSSIVVIALTVTIVSYLISDLAILPASNNTIATVSDLVLSIITIWTFNYIFPGAVISFYDAFMASVGIVVGEWIFHKFMAMSILPNRE